MSDLRSAFSTQICWGLPQSIRKNAGVAPKVGPLPIPFISFPIHYSLVILAFHAVSQQMRSRYVNEEQLMRNPIQFSEVSQEISQLKFCRHFLSIPSELQSILIF
jgi:hypothetical protein